MMRCVVFTAMLLSVLVHASCSGQIHGERARYRDFKDQRGRTIQARVVRTSGDDVTIERSDGRQFTVSASIFSQADQDYIRSLASGRKPSLAGDDWPRFRGPEGREPPMQKACRWSGAPARTSCGRPICLAPVRQVPSPSAIASTLPAIRATASTSDLRATWATLSGI